MNKTIIKNAVVNAGLTLVYVMLIAFAALYVVSLK
jgi:hypothetical protein